jgi:PAS domain S-box-containing protein
MRRVLEQRLFVLSFVIAALSAADVAFYQYRGAERLAPMWLVGTVVLGALNVIAIGLVWRANIRLRATVQERDVAVGELHSREERFALAMKGANDGVWDWNLETNEIYYSARWKSMLGYAEDEVPGTLEAFERALHPDDRQRALSTIEDYLAGRAQSFESEVRLRRKNGEYMYSLGRATLTRNADGRPVRLVGTMVDITERRLAEERLAVAERKYREIFENSVQGIYQRNRDGLFLTAAAFARMIGYPTVRALLESPAEFSERVWVDPAARAEFAWLIETDGIVTGFEVELRRVDGSTIWTSENARAVHDPRTGEYMYYESFIEDISARKSADQMKTDFVSFVTHQLRTPLTGIRWMLELARNDRLSGETAAYVDDARGSAERLIGLVNDLLDVTKLESGRLFADASEVDLCRLIHVVAGEMMPLVTAKRQSMTLLTQDDVPDVLIDAQLARQLVINLLSNAIKYTPEGGRISVGVHYARNQVALAVSDSGIGIPAGSQTRLFEKFYRASNASIADTEGTGLGLYMVRLIAERAGGRAWCESREGEGSTFTVAFPPMMKELAA